MKKGGRRSDGNTGKMRSTDLTELLEEKEKPLEMLCENTFDLERPALGQVGEIAVRVLVSRHSCDLNH